MDKMICDRNRKLADKIIKGLESRQMKGYYAESREEALQIALDLIPEGSKIGKGGTVSVEEIGLLDVVKTEKYHFIDRTKMDPKAATLESYTADVFLGSVNAITEDGILVNIDGASNRVSAYAWGPEKLVLVVGMNKVAPDLDSALKRARNVAAPINAQRFDLDTPCKKTGSCFNCKSPDSICCQFLITRFSRLKDRIHVILVNDFLGY